MKGRGAESRRVTQLHLIPCLLLLMKNDEEQRVGDEMAYKLLQNGSRLTGISVCGSIHGSGMNQMSKLGLMPLSKCDLGIYMVTNKKVWHIA